MALPWWNPFAVERYALHTRLSPTECHDRLRQLQVDYATSARSYAGPVYGYVGGKRFWLVRNSKWRPGIGPVRRSPFTFAARGRIAAASEGAIISMMLSFNPTISILLTLSLVLCIGLSLLPLFIHPTQAYGLGTILALDGAFLAVSIGTYGLGRWLARDDGEYLLAYLRKLLVAHDVV